MTVKRSTRREFPCYGIHLTSMVCLWLQVIAAQEQFRQCREQCGLQMPVCEAGCHEIKAASCRAACQVGDGQWWLVITGGLSVMFAWPIESWSLCEPSVTWRMILGVWVLQRASDDCSLDAEEKTDIDMHYVSRDCEISLCLLAYRTGLLLLSRS